MTALLSCLNILNSVSYTENDSFREVKGINIQSFLGIMLPLFGTCIGASFVFFMKKSINNSMNSILSGFAAGIMTAASVWSLLIPSIERSESFGSYGFVVPVIGLWSGVVIIMLCEKLVDHMAEKNKNESAENKSLQILAVTLHNIPEGMAVGAIWAANMSDSTAVPVSCAFALCLGVAIQNIPEGAIVSMPFYAQGKSRLRSFFYGSLSGAVEPVGALITLTATAFINAFLPLFLSAAAGAMLYVVADELVPEMRAGDNKINGMISYILGFSIMMALDVSLG